LFIAEGGEEYVFPGTLQKLTNFVRVDSIEK